MRKIIYVLALASVMLAQATFAQQGCNTNTPGWGNNLGRVSFVSNQTWTIGNQTWSDAVTATACQKTAFNIGNPRTGNYSADCRSNPEHRGDLFSWCAVTCFANQLCPYPWRVPTRDDFIALDQALGGSGKNRCCFVQFVTDNYINRWGGVFGGISNPGGSFSSQGLWGVYWSLSERNIYFGYILKFDTVGNANPQLSWRKYLGLALRCVRTITP